MFWLEQVLIAISLWSPLEIKGTVEGLIILHVWVTDEFSPTTVRFCIGWSWTLALPLCWLWLLHLAWHWTRHLEINFEASAISSRELCGQKDLKLSFEEIMAICVWLGYALNLYPQIGNIYFCRAFGHASYKVQPNPAWHRTMGAGGISPSCSRHGSCLDCLTAEAL